LEKRQNRFCLEARGVGGGSRGKRWPKNQKKKLFLNDRLHADDAFEKLVAKNLSC
jgi:hypothetical protein